MSNHNTRYPFTAEDWLVSPGPPSSSSSTHRHPSRLSQETHAHRPSHSGLSADLYGLLPHGSSIPADSAGFPVTSLPYHNHPRHSSRQWPPQQRPYPPRSSNWQEPRRPSPDSWIFQSLRDFEVLVQRIAKRKGWFEMLEGDQVRKAIGRLGYAPEGLDFVASSERGKKENPPLEILWSTANGSIYWNSTSGKIRRFWRTELTSAEGDGRSDRRVAESRAPSGSHIRDRGLSDLRDRPADHEVRRPESPWQVLQDTADLKEMESDDDYVWVKEP